MCKLQANTGRNLENQVFIKKDIVFSKILKKHVFRFQPKKNGLRMIYFTINLDNILDIKQLIHGNSYYKLPLINIQIGYVQ